MNASNTETSSLTVNGEPKSIEYRADESLMRALRRAGHTEIKNGCDQGVCGSCNVVVGEDKVVQSCVVSADQHDGDSITTAKGFTDENGDLHPVQEALLDHGAAQCGFCIPGTVVSAVDLLKREHDPSEDEIRRAIERNICRCTGYAQQFEAIRDAADRMDAEERIDRGPRNERSVESTGEQRDV